MSWSGFIGKARAGLECVICLIYCTLWGHHNRILLLFTLEQMTWVVQICFQLDNALLITCTFADKPTPQQLWCGQLSYHACFTMGQKIKGPWKISVGPSIGGHDLVAGYLGLLSCPMTCFTGTITPCIYMMGFTSVSVVLIYCCQIWPHAWLHTVEVENTHCSNLTCNHKKNPKK